MTQPAMNASTPARPAWDVKYLAARARNKAEAFAWREMDLARAAPGSELERQIAAKWGVLPPRNIMDHPSKWVHLQ
jgi:hypothetical protein